MLRVADGLDLVHLDGDAIGFLPASRRVVRLNPAAASIVAAVEAGFAWPEIVATLAELGAGIDPARARDELLESGILLDSPPADAGDEAGPTPGGELARPHCADPVGAADGAVGFAVVAAGGPVSFRTDAEAVADRVASAFPAGVVAHEGGALGWAVTAHVEPDPPPGGRGPRRLHELRLSGVVVARTRSIEALVEWSVQSLALRLLSVTPTNVPVVGTLQAGESSSRLWVGATADELRVQGSVPRHQARPTPAIVLVDGRARTPAAVAGARATEPDPGPIVLVVPEADRSSQLARILAAVPGDLARQATTEQLARAVGVVPWESPPV